MSAALANALKRKQTSVKDVMIILGIPNQTDAVHAVKNVKTICVPPMELVLTVMMVNTGKIVTKIVKLDVKRACVTGMEVVFRVIMNIGLALRVGCLALVISEDALHAMV